MSKIRDGFIVLFIAPHYFEQFQIIEDKPCPKSHEIYLLQRDKRFTAIILHASINSRGSPRTGGSHSHPSNFIHCASSRVHSKMKMFLRALVVIGFAAVLTAEAKPAGGELPMGRVVNGVTAKPGDAPWHVLIRTFTTDGGEYYCSGALISNQWVVTVAECTRNAQAISVLVGAVEFGVGTAISARRFVVNPEYLVPDDIPFRADYNIAVIQLSKTVPINQNIRPIALPPLRREHFGYDGQNVRLSGYGSYGKFRLRLK